MDLVKTPFLLAVAVGTSCLATAQAPASIRLNTLGYLPEAPKRATVAAEATGFAVVRTSDGAEVFTGQVSEARQNPDTDERLAEADFSALRVPGTYRLRVGDAVSPEFRIDGSLYREPFVLVTRAMYLWRCGMAVAGEWQGVRFAHEACHTDDAWLDFVTGEHTRRDSTGGWHDAGDYNKYVVNAGVTLGSMLRAWEEFPALRQIGLDLPESGGALPDFLAEIKFETDWLLTMQAPDGSVYTKVSTQRFGPFILPEAEDTPRYFSPAGTPATADFVAMLAQAARVMRPYDAAYAERLLAAARRSQAFLDAHPEHIEPDQSQFKTGGYRTKDPDDRLWALAELWETTGEPSFLADFERRLRELTPTFDENFDWAEVKNLGLLTYLYSERPGRAEDLVGALRADLRAVADRIVAKAGQHGYGRPLDRYYWGCNGGVARQTHLLQAAYRLAGDKRYREVALDAINHLFGRNVHGRSYVTGLGHEPPLHPHDRRSGGDQVEPPWPGYLVGGPNPGARDWFDVEPDARTNEFAINWNAALIYALAGFLAG